MKSRAAQRAGGEEKYAVITVVKGRSPITGRAFVEETEPLRQRALEEKAKTGRKWPWEDLEGMPFTDISAPEEAGSGAQAGLSQPPRHPSRPTVLVRDGFFAPEEEYADDYTAPQEEVEEGGAGATPLFVCLGEAVQEFVPTVRVNPDAGRADHDDLTSWRTLQADPPEWARAPGGPASNMAVALARLSTPAGGQVALLGKVGDDAAGWDLIHLLNCNGVQTRGVRVDSSLRTSVRPVRLEEGEDGSWRAAPAADPNPAAFSWPQVNKAILDDAAIVHFGALSLVEDSLRETVLAAVRRARERGALVMFDLNLPLSLWESRERATAALEEAWRLADIVEVSKQELEFLLGEEVYELKRRRKQLSYTAGSASELKSWREEYHYKPAELGPLLHAGLRLLVVTDGTYRLHYYTPSFHGSVEGTEDILLSPFTMDRSGSGDAIVAAIMTKLVEKPGAFEDERQLQIVLRYAVCAGIIAQWTLGSIKGLPTQSATQNLMEEVYVPKLVS